MMGRPSPFNNVKYYNTSSITSLQTITNVAAIVLYQLARIDAIEREVIAVLYIND